MTRQRVRNSSGIWSPRDPKLWPFRSSSPWNTPIGSNAIYEQSTDVQTANLIATTISGTPIVAWINSSQYSHPIFMASASDTLATVTQTSPSTTFRYRIPNNATPDTGTDGNMHVIDPTRHYADETWQMSGSNPTWTVSYHVRTDLYGSGIDAVPGGIRSAGVSCLGGLIRDWELKTGIIRHALAMVICDSQLKQGPVWPANTQDSNSGTAYSGQNPMGTMVAIPPSVNINSLSLNSDAKMVAKALQDYGAYVVDATTSDIALYAEPAANQTQVTNIRNNMNTIRAQLRVITNNSSTNVGGGGTPRQPLAPNLPTPPLS